MAVYVMAAIRRQDIRQNFETLCPSIGNFNGQYNLVLRPLPELPRFDESIFTEIAQQLAANPEAFIIVASDCLVQSGAGANALPSELAARIVEKYGPTPNVATLALTKSHGRVRDLDRVMAWNSDLATYAKTFDLILKKMEFLRRPNKVQPSNGKPIRIRLITDNETDFRKYFTLRHSIYEVMGYLDSRTESCRSRLEINEADTHAIHIGAFEGHQEPGRLVGTARIVTNTAPEQNLIQLFGRLAQNDPAIKERLRTPYGLGLPIFQSHDAMNDILRDVISKNVRCGELSRVAVSPDCRGLGISGELVQFALKAAVQKNVERVFLECLPVHQDIYRRHDFMELGVEGGVVDVARTMVAMELKSQRIQDLRNIRRGAARKQNDFAVQSKPTSAF